MGKLLVRDVPDDVVRALEERAHRHGRSTEEEHREILHQALLCRDDEQFEVLAAMCRALTSGRSHTPSEENLREDRDSR